MIRMLASVVFFSLALACTSTAAGPSSKGGSAMPATQAAPPVKKGQAEAVFAGGCFWCLESDLDKVPGVLSTTSGYAGGDQKGPAYKEVASGKTSHIESVRVVYDPKVLDYATLLDAFWHSVDPTQANGQFCDIGPHYRTAIFTSDEDERALAERTRDEAAATLGKTVVTEILPASTFWEAEEYHQDFYKKNPGHYLRYRMGCGRDQQLKRLWGEAASH